MKHMYADLIRKNDTVEILSGSRRELVHRFAIGDCGDVIGAYSVATMPDGQTDFELMEPKDLEAIEKAALRISGGKPSPAWQYFKTEMQKKSVIKRHAKRLQGDRRGLMKDDEARRLDMTFAATNRETGETDPPDDLPKATDGTPAPTPRRVTPEVPPKEDRLLTTQEQDDAFDGWVGLGGKKSALSPFLQKQLGVDDLAQVKLSQLEPLTAAMAAELAG